LPVCLSEMARMAFFIHARQHHGKRIFSSSPSSPFRYQLVHAELSHPPTQGRCRRTDTPEAVGYMTRNFRFLEEDNRARVSVPATKTLQSSACSFLGYKVLAGRAFLPPQSQFFICNAYVKWRRHYSTTLLFRSFFGTHHFVLEEPWAPPGA